MGTPMMDAKGLYKAYGVVKVLEDISLTVETGEAHVVIGPNGAGKTTLFRCLSGESRIDRGSITFESDDVTRLPEWRRVHRGIGRSFQVASIFADMTVEDNLVVAVEARERARSGLFAGLGTVAPSAHAIGEVEQLLDDLALADAAREPAATLSHGDKKRLELAMSLALAPRLLMLDEPTAGMSPANRAEAVAMLTRVRKRYGLTLLLTEHDMEVVFGLATRLTVLHHGRIIVSGEPESVRMEPRVREVYLGHA